MLIGGLVGLGKGSGGVGMERSSVGSEKSGSKFEISED
jgi:hypothetical protein